MISVLSFTSNSVIYQHEKISEMVIEVILHVFRFNIRVYAEVFLLIVRGNSN